RWRRRQQQAVIRTTNGGGGGGFWSSSCQGRRAQAPTRRIRAPVSNELGPSEARQGIAKAQARDSGQSNSAAPVLAILRHWPCQLVRQHREEAAKKLQVDVEFSLQLQLVEFEENLCTSIRLLDVALIILCKYICNKAIARWCTC
uniref:Uncharacterized protein n=1 Tax=Triticum urartu TaxID=4572 RepID=A0A8R7V9U8_TRIUA